MPNYYFSYEEEKFYEDKKYFVKITTSNKKFDLITNILKIIRFYFPCYSLHF